MGLHRQAAASRVRLHVDKKSETHLLAGRPHYFNSGRYSESEKTLGKIAIDPDITEFDAGPVAIRIRHHGGQNREDPTGLVALYIIENRLPINNDLQRLNQLGNPPRP